MGANAEKIVNNAKNKASAQNATSPTVTCGKTIGYPNQAIIDCYKAAAGRKSKKLEQTGSNCGMEAMRQLINRFKNDNISEDKFLEDNWLQGGGVKPWQGATLGAVGGAVDFAADAFHFISFGKVSPPKVNIKIDDFKGGSDPGGQAFILNWYKLPSTPQAATMENLEKALNDGKGILFNGNAGNWWPKERGVAPGDGTNHVVRPTAIDYDAQGKPIQVHMVDTGLGECDKIVPIEVFEKAMKAGGASFVVTNDRVYTPPKDGVYWPGG